MLLPLLYLRDDFVAPVDLDLVQLASCEGDSGLQPKGGVFKARLGAERIDDRSRGSAQEKKEADASNTPQA